MNKKIFGVVGVSIVCGIACFLIGCYSNVLPHNNVVIQQSKKSESKSYDRLAENWNRSVRNLNLPSKYEIKDRRNTEDIAKLFNTLLNNVNSAKKFQQNNQCVLSYHGNIFLPSKKYFDFLKKNELHYKIHFTKDTPETEIIEELKKVSKSKYINNELVEKIVSLSNFAFYFKQNRKKFIKDGFSKYINNFKSYKIAISKCR